MSLENITLIFASCPNTTSERRARTDYEIDADNPPVGSVQTAHYGWEIYLGGQRVAGPGHVFFAANIILPHYRNAQRKQVEDTDLKMSKSGVIGTGSMTSKTQYYKLK